MMGHRRSNGSGVFNVATVGAALFAALTASCGLSVSGLNGGTPDTTSSSGGTPGATSGSGAGGASASTEGPGGGAAPTAGAGGGGGATSASSATGGTSTTLLWHSYDVTVDTSNGALSVPAAAPATMPAKLIVYHAGSLDDMSTKVNLTTYHMGELDYEYVSWYVSTSNEDKYPYVGRSAFARTASQGSPEPLTALDLQVGLQDNDKRPVFVAFDVPSDGAYKLKELAVRQTHYNITDNTVVVVHLKRGSTSSQVGTPLAAGSDQKWRQSTTPGDLTMPLTKGDQIVFEVEPGSSSSYDAIELAWTIEAAVP